MTLPTETAADLAYADSAEAREYNRKRRWLSVIDAVLGFALLLLILISGFTKNMRDLAVRFSRDHYALALFLYIVFLAAILKFAAFGLDYFSFRLEHYYHLSNQKLRSWLLDELKARIRKDGDTPKLPGEDADPGKDIGGAIMGVLPALLALTDKMEKAFDKVLDCPCA